MLAVFIIFAVFAGLFFTVFFGAPYVPAKINDVKTAFDDLRPLTKNDVVVDLGSGDGKVLREVSRRGARAVGYELHPLLVAISKILSRHDPNVTIHFGNFWSIAFPKNVTVIYIFGDGRDIKKMTQKIEAQTVHLKKPLDVLSYGFTLPGHICVKSAGAHNLYRIEPLHSKKA